MHVAFLTPEYPHQKIKNSGGLGTSIKNLVTALVTQNIKVSVFVYGQPKQEIFEENGITFHFISNQKYRFAKWFFYRKYIEKYINKVVDAEKINLIEAPDWTGITAFMKFKVPLVIRFHGSDTYFCHLENRKQKLKNFWFEKLALQQAIAFVAPTKFAGELSAKLFKIDSRKVTTIHYGLALHQFENTTPEKFENGLLLYIGTIIRKKGVLELPAIFHEVRKQFPNANLVFIGADSGDIQTNNTSTWSLVEHLIPAEDKSNVQFLGKISYAEVQEYIKKAHVCVFPTFAETLGMVTIESMALQKPVVNSNIGWANELLIDEESGFLVHPTNHKLFADRILQLLESEDLTKKIGQKANERVVAKFDIDKKVLENISFYKKILDAKKN